MSPRDIIQKKRDGGELTPAEIAFFIRAYMNLEVPEYQMAAFLMAVYFQGMTPEETLALTREMRDSGKTLDLSSIPSPKVDKHSTGGVGDKTSIVLAPIVAACGVVVPMITGRSLGHTGGTLDKLQSIPGFDPLPRPEAVMRCLKSAGAVIMGQTGDFAPADRRIYALRDVTATIESIPLITASILSKKLAQGIDGLVMDVKTGSGAFMPAIEMATQLSRSIAGIGRKMKVPVVVLITDMEQPLGRAIGNALEIHESIQFLKGNTPEDLETVSLGLAAHMIRLAGRAKTIEQASKMAYEAVSKGHAEARFRQLLRAQGADDAVLDNPDMLPAAKHVDVFRAQSSGYIYRCDARNLGLAANALGAGRQRLEDTVDPAAGLYLEKKMGERVTRGDTLCRIYWNDERRLRNAVPLIEQAYQIRSRAPERRPLIHAILI